MPSEITIIGAGPAGASLAYYLSKESKFEIKIYESHDLPGKRPCGWGAPKQIEKFVPIPKDFILNHIDRIDLFLDNQLQYTAEFKGGWGYIIDKPRWLMYLLKSSRAKIFMRTPFNLNYIKTQRANPEHIMVLATGRVGVDSKYLKLNTIEYLLKTNSWSNNKIEFWFDSSFVGYTWVFPRGEDIVSVGVGAFKNIDFLKKYLDIFVKRHYKLQDAYKLYLLGDSLVVNGLSLKNVMINNNTFVIGEAAGAVFPITGEGIRPSIITSYALYKTLSTQNNFMLELKKTGLPVVMNVHKIILWLALNSTPEERASLLKALPFEKSASLAIGEFSKEDVKNLHPIFEVLFEQLEKNEIDIDEYFNQYMEQANK